MGVRRARRRRSRGGAGLIPLVLLTALHGSAAQDPDERRATSPDGRVEFRVGPAPQAPGYLSRLAYELYVDGRAVMARSYMGFDVLNQEPLLGEKAGLIGSQTGAGPGYRSVSAEYMQDGSLGHKITIEARVYNDGVAFRYVLPWSAPLADLLIADEVTEFHFAAGAAALKGVPETGEVALPYTADLPRSPVEILETGVAGFPMASLARLNADTLVTRLPRLAGDAEVAYKGHAPWVGPWHVILLGKKTAQWVGTLPER